MSKEIGCKNMKVPCLLRAALCVSGSGLLHARCSTEGCKYVTGADSTGLKVGACAPAPRGQGPGVQRGDEGVSPTFLQPFAGVLSESGLKSWGTKSYRCDARAELQLHLQPGPIFCRVL